MSQRISIGFRSGWMWGPVSGISSSILQELPACSSHVRSGIVEQPRTQISLHHHKCFHLWRAQRPSGTLCQLWWSLANANWVHGATLVESVSDCLVGNLYTNWPTGGTRPCTLGQKFTDLVVSDAKKKNNSLSKITTRIFFFFSLLIVCRTFIPRQHERYDHRTSPPIMRLEQYLFLRPRWGGFRGI